MIRFKARFDKMRGFIGATLTDAPVSPFYPRDLLSAVLSIRELCGSNRVLAIKIVRDMKDFTLKEAKDLFDFCPAVGRLSRCRPFEGDVEGTFDPHSGDFMKATAINRERVIDAERTLLSKQAPEIKDEQPPSLGALLHAKLSGVRIEPDGKVAPYPFLP